jgi:hypothetical protein
MDKIKNRNEAAKNIHTSDNPNLMTIDRLTHNKYINEAERGESRLGQGSPLDNDIGVGNVIEI